MKLLPKPLLVLMVLIVGSLSVYAGTQFPNEIWFIKDDVAWMGSEKGILSAYIGIWYGEKEGSAATMGGCVYFNREPLLSLWGKRQGSNAQGKWESITGSKGSWEGVFKEDRYSTGFVKALLTFTKDGKGTTKIERCERVFPPYNAKEIAPVPRKD